VRVWRCMLLCTLNMRLHPSKVHLNAVACGAHPPCGAGLAHCPSRS
jgi:hypothetical protein